MTKFKRYNFVDGEARTANKGLAIAGGQWLIEGLCFYFTFVLADGLVLLKARHRQAPKRYGSYIYDLYQKKKK
jgi:hypothetical protein